MMEYKGYIGNITVDTDAMIMHGDVINTRDVITFQGTSLKELTKAFHESVDDYLKWCEEDGIDPEKPYSGKFNIRIAPELHQKAAIAASLNGLSLNRFVERAITDELALTAAR